jgi:ribosomal protein L32
MAETSPHAGHLEAYECPTCGCWHLGHTATTRARDLRNAHMQAEMDALSNDPET